MKIDNFKLLIRRRLSIDISAIEISIQFRDTHILVINIFGKEYLYKLYKYWNKPFYPIDLDKFIRETGNKNIIKLINNIEIDYIKGL